MSKKEMLDFMTRDATRGMEGASYVIGLIANDLRDEANAEERDDNDIINAANVLENLETNLYRQARSTKQFYREAMEASDAETGKAGDAKDSIEKHVDSAMSKLQLLTELFGAEADISLCHEGLQYVVDGIVHDLCNIYEALDNDKTTA